MITHRSQGASGPSPVDRQQGQRYTCAVDVPYALVCAVQDLYSLHQQLSPAGPYRLALFHEQPARQAARPELSRRAQQLDVLVRAAGTLLGSQLSAAVKPIAVELWQGVRRLWRDCAGAQASEPQRFRALSAELLTLGWEAPPSAIYRLYGEVLAEYLALLAGLQPATDGDWPARVAALRQALESAALA